MKSQDEENDFDPFLCGCASCDTFWYRLSCNKLDRNLIRKQPQRRAADTSALYAMAQTREKHPAILRIGDRVLVKGQYKGVVKYVGVTDDITLSPNMYVGVKLDNQIGSVHNGINMKNGKRYFHCPRGHGALVKYTEVKLLRPVTSKPPVYGNSMFPSYAQIRKARMLRAQLDPNFDLGQPYTKRPSSSLPKVYFKQQQTRPSSSSSSLEILQSSGEQAKQLKNWKKQFGGGERAEMLLKTLQRLQLAYEEGRKFIKKNGEDWEGKLNQDNMSDIVVNENNEHTKTS